MKRSLPVHGQAREVCIFRALYSGTKASILVGVTIGSTLANRNSDGIWTLTHEDFRQMADSIAGERGCEGWEIADALDSGGCGNRWFRMSRQVKEWLENEEPVVLADASIS